MTNLLISTVSILFTLLYWFIIIRVILSWFGPNIDDPRWRSVLQLIYNITEPILAPIRNLLPTGNIGIDFSPFIAIIALSIIRSILVSILRSIAL